ncbi:NYN domain-containing protein [Indiicoccus explosivorum]|uniref:NYN domain-containing protein n=1 Tax=Indiicoccus explosivorum TaxID=1917864 RepID=UPI000B443D47|nr:NYN domain-containing protein [Indiicoccus explosivorum]
MLNQLTNPKPRLKIFMDYENLASTFPEHTGKEVRYVNFFERLRHKLEKQFTIVSIKGYANFDSPFFQSQREQGWLTSAGVEPKHCSVGTKSTTDVQITIDVMKDLSQPAADVYALITNDRDFAPLLQEIRNAGKQALLICTAGGTNDALPKFADAVLELEDLFGIKEASFSQEVLKEAETISYTTDEANEAEEVLLFLQGSSLYKKAKIQKIRISLKGFACFCQNSGKWKFSKVIHLVKIAHRRGLLQLMPSDTDDDLFFASLKDAGSKIAN